MTDDLRDFADSHGYVRWSYLCDECGYRASGWSDSPMDDDDKCPGCGYEPREDKCLTGKQTARSPASSPRSACSS